MRDNRIFYSFVAVMVAIAVTLGYFIVRNTVFTPQQNQQDASENAQRQLPQLSKESTQTASLSQKLNFKIPGASASAQEQRDFFMQAKRKAEDASALDITGCSPKPSILHVKPNTSIVVKNADTKARKMIIRKNPQRTFTIPANGQQSVNISFLGTNHISGYSCDNDASVVGLLIVY